MINEWGDVFAVAVLPVLFVWGWYMLRTIRADRARSLERARRALAELEERERRRAARYQAGPAAKPTVAEMDEVRERLAGS